MWANIITIFTIPLHLTDQRLRDGVKKPDMFLKGERKLIQEEKKEMKEEYKNDHKQREKEKCMKD